MKLQNLNLGGWRGGVGGWRGGGFPMADAPEVPSLTKIVFRPFLRVMTLENRDHNLLLYSESNGTDCQSACPVMPP